MCLGDSIFGCGVFIVTVTFASWSKSSESRLEEFRESFIFAIFPIEYLRGSSDSATGNSDICVCDLSYDVNKLMTKCKIYVRDIFITDIVNTCTY